MAGSLRDIAGKHKISVATLSRVINNQPGVHPKTRQRVLKILEQEKYIPNNIARSLRKNSTGIVGVIVPDIKQQFFDLIIGGLDSVSVQGTIRLKPCNFRLLLRYPHLAYIRYAVIVCLIKARNFYG